MHAIMSHANKPYINITDIIFMKKEDFVQSELKER